MATTDHRRDRLVTENEQQSKPGSACPECDGRVCPTSNDERACGECGLIVDEPGLDDRPNWNPQRVDSTRRTGGGRTPSLHDHGLTTEISHYSPAGKPALSNATKRKFARLRKWHRQSRFQQTGSRYLADGLGEIRRVTSALEQSRSVREQACRLYRTIRREDLIHGRSIEGMAAATVYATSRCNQSPMLLKDVASVARVSVQHVQRCYDVLNQELELAVPPRPPVAFVPRLASTLDVDDPTRRTARTLATAVREDCDVVGSHPAGVAGACLYVASQETNTGQSVPQLRVADAATVSPKTIRSHASTVRENAPDQHGSESDV